MEVDLLYSMSRSEANLAVVGDYLRLRGFDVVLDDVGYVKVFSVDGSHVIYDSLLFFCRDLSGRICQVESRSRLGKSFCKEWRLGGSIPIWRVGLIPSVKTVILTESVLDAESFNSFGVSGVCAISTMSAGLSVAQRLFLVALLKYRTVYVAFDSDEVGVKRALSFQEFCFKSFGMDVRLLDFPYKDLNDFFKKKKNTFLTTLLNQIF